MPAQSLRLLLLSNSRSPDGVSLQWARREIEAFLGSRSTSLLFIPYAAVPGTAAAFDAYANRVRTVFADMNYACSSVHEAIDPVAAVQGAAAIVIGGGNTFHLLTQLYAVGLMDALTERVRAGVPYIGWSAGSVVTGPTISTTNDMPIIEPPSLRALALVPFQINAHYTDAHPPGHQGETRGERIAEFLALQPSVTVIGLRELSLLHVEGQDVRLVGVGARLFRAGVAPVEWAETDGSLAQML